MQKITHRARQSNFRRDFFTETFYMLILGLLRCRLPVSLHHFGSSSSVFTGTVCHMTPLASSCERHLFLQWKCKSSTTCEQLGERKPVFMFFVRCFQTIDFSELSLCQLFLLGGQLSETLQALGPTHSCDYSSCFVLFDRPWCMLNPSYRLPFWHLPTAVGCNGSFVSIV